MRYEDSGEVELNLFILKQHSVEVSGTFCEKYDGIISVRSDILLA
jgi:hypothetical protein